MRAGQSSAAAAAAAASLSGDSERQTVRRSDAGSQRRRSSNRHGLICSRAPLCLYLTTELNRPRELHERTCMRHSTRARRR